MAATTIVSNEYIEFMVRNGGDANGRFTVGTTGGNPSNPNDDNKKMLYGHPYPGTSYTTIRVDGENHIYNPETQYPTSNPYDFNNISEETIKNVSIKQVISIVESTSTQRKDTIQIKYIVKNNDNVGHDMGLRIMMDTMLGGEDKAPFRVPGIGIVTKEIELSGYNIPEFWQAFDNLSNPVIISQGTLLRDQGNKPDKVQFTNWERAYDAPWDYTVNPSYDNGDSAMSIYWNTRILYPGDTREYVTYYGLSELVQDLRPPLAVSITGATNIECTESGYSPDPFTVTAYIMNNGTGSANNVKIKIALPEGLELVAGKQEEYSLGTLYPSTEEKQVSWLVKIWPSEINRNLTYSVTVRADNAENKTLSRNITIPALGTKAVIIIPGTCGTSLHTTGGRDVWAPKKNDLGAMDLLECDHYGTPTHPEVEIVPLPDNPLIKEYYGPMKDTLEKKLKCVVYIFPYDWRLNLSSTTDKLKDFINEKLTKLGIQKVSIVAHSLGGLVAAKYISNGNADKIDKLLTIATPFLGSPKALYVFETGNFLGNNLGDLFLHGKFKKYSPNMASVYQLLPSEMYFDPYPCSGYDTPPPYHLCSTYYIEECTLKPILFKEVYSSRQKMLDFKDTEKFLLERDWKNEYLLDGAKDFHNLLDLRNSLLLSDNSYFIIGDIQSTIGKILEKFDKDGKFKNCDIEPANGDGTVPIISATMGFRTDSSNTYYYSGKHADLPKTDHVIEQVANILNNTPSIYAEGIHRDPQSCSKLKAKTDCPVDLHMYDSSGNHLGPMPDGIVEEDISSGSYYIHDDGTKIAFVNEDNYSVEIYGTDEGTMTYTLQEYDENDVLDKTIKFNNVKITPTTRIHSDTDLSKPIELMIDENGDGTVDKIIQPSVIVDGEANQDETPPTISLEADGSQGNNGWYKSDVKLSLNAQDSGSGINSIEYILNDSEVQTYQEPLVISKEGKNLIKAIAFDNNDNYSDEISREINIDKTVPVITVNIPVSDEIAVGSSIKIDFSATDTISGIESVQATLNDNPFTSGSTLLVQNPGENIIIVTATDNAGNTTTRTAQFSAYIPAKITMSPNKVRINKINNSKMIFATIKLPDGYSSSYIDINSITLNGKYMPLGRKPSVNIGNRGKKELVVAFWIPDIPEVVVNGNIPIHIEGKCKDYIFKGDSMISVTSWFFLPNAPKR